MKAGYSALLVLGAATRPGRMAVAIDELARALTARSHFASVDILSFAETPIAFCDGRAPADYDQATNAAVQAALDADAVVLASPVYRGTYSGVLKNYLDLLPLEALEGKPVGIVAMGATLHHFLGVESQLRPVLAWFGAIAMPVAIYLSNDSFGPDRSLSSEVRTEFASLADSMARVVTIAVTGALGPRALAARSPGATLRNPDRGAR